MVPHPMDNQRAAIFAVCLSLACPVASRGQEAANYSARGPEQRLTLAEALARLESGNREIIAARRALDVASSSVTLAGALPNPTLGASVSSINPNRGLGAGGLRDRQMDSILRMDQVVERGEKRELRIASAGALVEAARRDLAEVRRQQRLALDTTYYDLKLALEKLRIQRDTAALHTQSVGAAERRLKAGDTSESEVVRLRVEALRAANDALGAEADVQRARQALAALIGEPALGSELVPADDWPTGAANAAAPSPESVQSRADVRAAQARVEAAERARELARRLRTRDVTVGAQVERFPPDPGLSYGVSFSVPLFLRYNFEGEIAQAEAELTAAMAARDRQVLLAISEVRRAQNDLLASAERRRRLADELLPQARKSLDAAEFAYQRGATGLLDLLDSRRTLRALELEAVTATADYAKARSALAASLTVDSQ
jgi:cobalt-zinc-cadmium efflux system outer membrane protein